MFPSVEVKRGVPAKDTVADQLFDFANKLAQQIQALSDRVNNRLDPISRPNIPDTRPTEVKGEQVWPPYFAKMREPLCVIETHIHIIGSALDRLEV